MILLAALLQAAPALPPEPDAQLIALSLNMPVMTFCDELSCAYRQPDRVAVRRARCAEPEQDARGALLRCRFEQARQTRNGAWAGPWEAATASFRLYRDDLVGPAWVLDREDD